MRETPATPQDAKDARDYELGDYREMLREKDEALEELQESGESELDDSIARAADAYGRSLCTQLCTQLYTGLLAAQLTTIPHARRDPTLIP